MLISSQQLLDQGKHQTRLGTHCDRARFQLGTVQLLNALAQRAPLVLFVDDLQWVDVASLDLVRYLGRFCKEHSCKVLWLCTVRGEELELNSQLSTLLDNLGRDLPVTQVSLQTLNQAETLQLIEEVQQLGERLGTNRRFRIPYLRSLAVLDTWEGKRERTIDHLREAVSPVAEPSTTLHVPPNLFLF